MKEFLKKYKRSIISLALTLALLVSISVISLLLLTVFDIIYIDDGLQFNHELFASFRDSWYGWIIFIIMQTVLSMFLCFIPGASMAFIILSTYLYPNPIEAFILCFVSVMSASFVMYWVGRKGGYRLCCRLLGDDDCEKATQLLRSKGSIYFPLMMMLPIFPDEALTMIAGTMRMKMSWFAPSVIIGRGIGIASIIFGISLIPFESFNGFYDWVVFITVCLFWMKTLFGLAAKLNKKIELLQKNEKHSKGESETVEEEHSI